MNNTVSALEKALQKKKEEGVQQEYFRDDTDQLMRQYQAYQNRLSQIEAQNNSFSDNAIYRNLLARSETLGGQLRNNPNVRNNRNYSNYLNQATSYNDYRRQLNNSQAAPSSFALEYNRLGYIPQYESHASSFSPIKNQTNYGWLDPNGGKDVENAKGRYGIYQSNKNRLDEILKEQEEILAGQTTAASIARFNELQQEAQKLTTENTKYEDLQLNMDRYADMDLSSITDIPKYNNPSYEQALEYVKSNDPALGLFRTLAGNTGNSSVEDKLGFYRSLSGEQRAELEGAGGLNTNYRNIGNDSVYGAAAGNDSISRIMREAKDNDWDYLDDREVKTYYAIYQQEGKDAAYKYLDGLKVELNRRRDTAENQKMADYAASGAWQGAAASALSVPLNVVGSMDAFVDDFGRVLTGQRINPYSYAHSAQSLASTAREAVAENINEETANRTLFGISLGDVYQSGMSMADMALGAVMGTQVYGASMGMGAASQKARELYERGASNAQIVAASLLTGAAEMFFEEYSLEKLKAMAAKSPTSLKRVVLNFLKQAFTEGSEEFNTEIADTLVDLLVMNENSEPMLNYQKYLEEGNSEERARALAFGDVAMNVWKSFVGGAISGGLSGGGVSAINYGGYKLGNSIQRSNAQNMNTQRIAQTIGENNTQEANILASVEIGNNITDEEAGQIFKNENAMKYVSEDLQISSDSVKDEAGLKNALNEYANGVKAVNNVVEKVMTGENITQKDAQVIAENKTAQRDLSNMLSVDSESLTTAEAVKSTLDKVAAGHSLQIHDNSGTIYSGTTEQNRITARENEIRRSLRSENRSLNPARGSMDVDGKVKDVVVHDFADAKAGTVYTEDGGTAKLDSVAFDDSDVAAAYQQARRYDTDTANIFINGFRGQEGYAAAFDHLFRMGQQGVAGSISSEYAKVKDAIDLTTALAAYGRGKQNDTSARAITRTENVKGGGLVKDYSESKLNRQQRASVEMVDTLGKILGVTFVVHETGRFKTGGIVLDLNGFFNQNDNTVHLSLNSVDGLILRTAGHELTHFMKKWNQEGYEAYRDVLKEEIGEERWEQMIRKQQEIHKKNTNRDVSREYAEEEVVADASERYLNDIETFKKLAERNRSAAQKLLEGLKEFIQKIRDAFSGKRGVYSEQSTVLSQLENFEQIRDQWADALGEAAETFRATSDAGIALDTDSDSAAPMFSQNTWTKSEYVQNREEAAETLAKALKVSKSKALRYIDDINSVAYLIAADKVRLDYNANEIFTMVKPDAEYKYTIDASTLCAKRRIFTGTMDKIQQQMKNIVLTAEDRVKIRDMMMKKGYEVACGICYVESSRKDAGPKAQKFIEAYKAAQKSGESIKYESTSGKTHEVKVDNAPAHAGSYVPTQYDLNTTEGIDALQKNHPDVYKAYVAYMNRMGQSKPKLLETRTEYRGEIAKFRKSVIDSLNAHGGLRLQSYSDFETPHLIDMMQVVLDMSRKGLKSQAYTKIPNFAKVFGGTGVKINLSLIAKGTGLDANGNLLFDDVEGMPHKEAFAIRERFSRDVGTILVGKNDAHIIAAMADPRIDFIIPFHKSQWNQSLYEALGLTGYSDYTDFQNEKGLDGSTVKNYDPSEYWDFSKTGDENAQIYLEKCRAEGRIPKFPQFSHYPGYWKLLIDFKMYDNNGVGVPQQVVRPEFQMDEAARILREYEGGANSFPVAQDVVDEFVQQKENAASEGDVKFSVNSAQSDITAEYQKTVDSILQNTYRSTDAVLLGYTPDLYTRLDMPSLPFVIGPGHIYASVKTEAEARAEGRYNSSTHYHGLGESAVKNIYQSVLDPVMIIASKDVNQNAVPLRSTHSVVAIVDIGAGGKHLLLPVEITAERTVNGQRMDVNMLSSAYIRDVRSLVDEAIAQENTGEVGIYYIKKEAAALIQGGVQFPRPVQSAMASNGIVHNFSEKVNMNISDAAQSRQFKRWFGDWQNDPQHASKIVNEDGTPKVVYHATDEDFTVFDREKLGRVTDGNANYVDRAATAHVGFWFNDADISQQTFQNGAMGVFLNIRKPYVVGSISDLATEIIDRSGEDYNELQDRFDDRDYSVARELGESFREYLEWNRYDGIIVDDEEFGGTSYVVFNSEQVKSATDNIGTFDGTNPDIRYSLNALDSAYLSAVESRNVEEQQRMVDEAAERLFADSKIRDEDGNLLKVYHGTDADFTVFDRSKGRSTMDIQGSFFSPWDIDAGGYGSNVRAFYLNITNPAPEGIAYRALNRFKGQNEAGIKAREYLESQGYDGVNNGDEEYIAFRSEQIKSADPVTYDDAGNVIPLSERFNPENEDIRFSINEALGDEYEEYQGRALVTEDTLDRWLKDYAASNPNYAQAYITYMTPDQFLRLTTTDAVSRSRIRSQSEGLTVQNAVEYSREQPVQLMINTETGKVEGHEGRHRMVAFDRAGIRKIPVLLFDSRNKYSKTAMDSLKLIGQDFNGRTNTDIETVQNVQPLSRGNRENLVSQFSTQTGTERVSERYGRQNVRFSINEDDFKNITHVLTGEKLSSEYVSALVELQNGRPITSEQYNAIPEIRQAKERLGAAGDETIRINTPERNRQRQKWATDLLDKFRSATVDKSGKTVYNGDVERGHRLDIVIGLPSSGKSSAVVDPLSYEHKSRLLDSDEAKKLIPEFDGGWGAGRVHEESQLVMREALYRSMQDGDNIVLPIVGAKLENVEKYLNEARKHGYTCYVHFNDLNPYKAMGRNLQRFATRGRFVDLDATSFRYGNGPREVFDDYVRRYGNGTARLLSVDGGDRAARGRAVLESRAGSGNAAVYQGRTQTQRAGESPSLISGYTEISNDVQRGSMPVQVSGTEQINFNWKREARANAEQKNSLNEPGRQDSEISPQLKEVMPRRDYEFYQMREELKASRLREDNLSTTVKTQENIIAGLREEFELTKGHKLKQQTINRLAQRLVKQYNSTYNVQELSENLGKLFDYIANGENLDWDSVMEISSTISKRILEESSTLNRELYDQYKGMRDYFRTQKISIPQDMRAEVGEYFGGWNNLRRQLFGRVNLVNNGASLDAHWNEIYDAWPEFFDREATPQEQVTQVISALDAIQPFHENPYGMNMDEAAYDLAQEIYEDYFSVPEVKTFADRQQQKLEQTIAHMTEMRNREKQRIRDRYEQKLSDLRKQKGEQMAALRERYEKARGQDREMYRERLNKLRVQKNEQLMRQQAKLRTEKMEAVQRQRDLRQAAYYKQRINRILQEFNQRLLSPTKEKHIPSKLISSMVEVCEIMNGAYDNAKARLALEDLQAAYSEMRAHEGTEENPFFDPVVADIAHLRETLAERQVKELSVADLKDVYDVLREVRHVVNTYNKAFVQGRKATISGYATDVMGEMNNVRKSKAALNNKVLDALKAFGWQNLKPIYAMRMIGSDTLTELYHNLRAGEDTWAVNVGKVRDVLLKARQKYGYNSWNTKAERTFRLQNGGTITLDLGHMMSMYALYKRQQAVAHMEQGGVVLDSESSKRKATAAPVQITFADMQQIVDAMTDNQRAFVDEMQRYLSVDMAALGNEVTRALYDIEKFTDPNYFPIKSSSDFIYNAQDKKEAAPKLINSSFTKDVVRFANNPVIISDFTDVWADHCNQMCMFNAMTLPLEDFTRVFNFKTSIEEGAAPVSVKTTLTNEFGGSKDAISYIEHMLRDVNGGVVNQAGVAGINKLVSLFKKGAVFASASVVIQQPSAVARALAIIDPKYFLKTSFSWGLYNEAMQWAPIARIKEMGYFDTGISRGPVEWITKSDPHGLREKVKAFVTDGNYRDDLLSIAPQKADAITWSHIWAACKAEQLDKGHFARNSEEHMRATAKRFTEVVERTQVYDSVFSRSEMMRSKDTGAKMVTAFMAEPTTSFNMLLDGFVQGKRNGFTRKGWAYTTRAAGAFVASVVLNAILKSFVTASRDDDDDKSYWEKYLGNVVGNIKDDINPLGLIPIARDIISIFQGYSVDRADMSLFEDLAKNFKKFQQMQEKGEADANTIMGFVGSLAAFLGLPVKNIWRDIKSVMNVSRDFFVNKNETDWNGIVYSIAQELGYDMSYKALAQQMLSGSSQAERTRDFLLQSGKTEDKINTEVRKYLSSDKTFQAYAEKYAGGELSALEDAIDHFESLGFNGEDVASALRTYADKTVNGKESSYTGTVAGTIYQYDDLFTAMESGNSADVTKIVNAIAEGYQASGKTLKEAKSTIRSQLTKNFKEQYIAADERERLEIRRMLNGTAVYDSLEALDDVLEGWLKKK